MQPACSVTAHSLHTAPIKVDCSNPERGKAKDAGHGKRSKVARKIGDDLGFRQRTDIYEIPFLSKTAKTAEWSKLPPAERRAFRDQLVKCGGELERRQFVD